MRPLQIGSATSSAFRISGLGTARYSGHPYPAHMHLPVEPEHFLRWVALFEETARETLNADLAEKAIGRARHMSASFQAGIFPFKDLITGMFLLCSYVQTIGHIDRGSRWREIRCSFRRA